MLGQYVPSRGVGESVRIRDLPASERPRERLAAFGVASLSSIELLALLLGSGSRECSALELAQRILADVGGLDGLARLDHAELCRWTGVGDGKAARVSAALELGVRLATTPDRPVAIRRTADVAALLRPRLSRLSQECFVVLVLDTGHRVLRVVEMYWGTANSTAIRVAELFRPAVACDAPAILLVHNHPGGSPEPSPEDIKVTRMAVAAGRLLSIEVVDHVIITDTRYASLRAYGVGFE